MVKNVIALLWKSYLGYYKELHGIMMVSTYV